MQTMLFTREDYMIMSCIMYHDMLTSESSEWTDEESDIMIDRLKSTCKTIRCQKAWESIINLVDK